MYSRGAILRVDLSSEKITRESISPELGEQYIGGEGINTRLFWEHFLKVDPRIDPVSKDNVIIWGLGPLGGTAFGGGSKSRWTFKGPAYGMFGDTTSGGPFGTQMRWAGYDHLVITGRARRPVYIWVNDDNIEIRDASKLWGKKVIETNEAIRQELGNREVETACIGPAGENLVTYASITVSGMVVGGERSAGRTGAGCVFGSKNLKAVAALGTRGITVHDRRAFLKAMDAMLATMYQPHPEREMRYRREHYMKYGSLGSIVPLNEMGYNGYRNAQWGQSPDVEKISGEWYLEHMQDQPYACSPGCAVACSGWHHIKGNESPLAKRLIGEYGTRPEYGHAAPFGVSCDVADLPEVTHLCRMCSEYGLDIFEIGMSISFLMELWQRGLITAEDTARWMGKPLSLEWGNYEAVENLIEAAGLQKNQMGKILKGSVYQTAKSVEALKGIPVLQYANYGKGGATHIESMRSRPSFSPCGALSTVGCHHLKGSGLDGKASTVYLGKPDAGNNFNYALKGAGQAISETFFSMHNSLGVCRFGGAPIRNCADFPPEVYTPALNAITGMEITPQALFTAGERIVNVQKAFNSRLGLRRKDDTVCHRWMNEPMPDGPGKGMKMADFLEQAKDEYYEYHGWDKATSLQKRQKLKELGLEDVVKVLEEEGVLA